MRDVFGKHFWVCFTQLRPKETRICCIVFVNTLAVDCWKRRNFGTKGKKGVKCVLESGLLERCLSHLLYSVVSSSPFGSSGFAT